MVEPRLIKGALVADDRGEVGFVNDFDFAEVKRFYLVSNHAAGFVRAWHGHRREAKYVTVVQGAMLVACVQIDNWEKPSPALPVQRFVLSAKVPAVLFIPAGFANGNMSLTDDARAMFFSTSTLEESKGDDIRFDARLWDPWRVEER
ncbi:MAG TPA: dTDP-4-dehydrorhamnose 3,5-epimerase family protein [Chthoniobacterales bacterium]|nr:dTDP-4-dehydrorhamnose 3,5-epimerase family protein [Chthoniobacterales bacterium]